MAGLKSKFGVLDGASMEDVALVSEAIYPIQKNGQLMTRIKSIKGHPVASLGVKVLDAWSASQGVRIPRKNKKKEDVCRLIMDFKVMKDRQDASVLTGSASRTSTSRGATSGAASSTGNTPPPSSRRAVEAAKRVTINYARLVNTISLETIKAAFMNRGGTLSRQDLDDGKKADHDLYEGVAKAYNTQDDVYLETFHWDVDWNHTPDLSVFDKINAVKAKSSIQSMSLAYDKAFQNWKVSGFNEGIEQVPFVRFAGGWIHYLHQMLEPHPDLLKSVTGDLPDSVFNESGSEKKQSRKRGRGGGDKGNGNGNVHDDSMSKMADAATKRSDAFAYAAIHTASMQTKVEINDAKDKRKAAMKSLKDHAKVRSGTKAKKIVNFMEGWRAKIAANDDDDDDDDDDDSSAFGAEDFPFSQQSITSFDTRVGYANEIIDQESVIETATNRLREQEHTMNCTMSK
jgi:hypothetical protein